MSQEREFDLSGLRVYLAIPSYMGSLPIETALEIAETKSQLKDCGVDLVCHAERGNGVITEVRNKLITKFLDSDCDYLFWLDDDMIFKTADFIKLLALATIKDCVAATYPTRSEQPIFHIHPIDRHGENEFDELGLLKAKGLGLGFTCIKRSVVEKLIATKETYIETNGTNLMYDVFRNGVVDKEYWGEDINFFYDLFDLGYITYVDIDIHLKHVGRKDYDARLILKRGES